MKHIETSPIDNSELQPYLRCKDHTVSLEEFTLLKDINNDLLITSPRPSDDKLGDYYDSSDYISHTDSKKSFVDRVYQLVRNYALKQKLKLINSFGTESKSILDIGAGTGDFLATCKNNGWDVQGIEPNEKARKIAQEKSGIDLKSEISNLKSGQYDVITMWHVLEHVPNLNETITELRNLLKPKGSLVIAVPNHKSFDAQHYKEYWAAYDVPRHLWHFSQASVRNLFSKQNMEVVKILPMKFDAYYVSLLSEKYKTGIMNPVKAFAVGLRSNLKAKRTSEYSSLIYHIKNR